VQESKNNFREEISSISKTTALSYVEKHCQVLDAVCYHFETVI